MTKPWLDMIPETCPGCHEYLEDCTCQDTAPEPVTHLAVIGRERCEQCGTDHDVYGYEVVP